MHIQVWAAPTWGPTGQTSLRLRAARRVNQVRGPLPRSGFLSSVATIANISSPCRWTPALHGAWGLLSRNMNRGATSHRWFEGLEIVPKGEKMGFVSECEICVPLWGITVCSLAAALRMAGPGKRSLQTVGTTGTPRATGGVLEVPWVRSLRLREFGTCSRCHRWGLEQLGEQGAELAGSDPHTLSLIGCCVGAIPQLRAKPSQEGESRA